MADEAISWLVTSSPSRRDLTRYLSLRQRAEALIGAGYPDFRAKLRQSFADARSMVLEAGR